MSCLVSVSSFINYVIQILLCLFVDNTVSSITVLREGLFGSATVDVRSGFPTGTFDGFTAGKILPDSNLVSFTGSTKNRSISVQVSFHEGKSEVGNGLPLILNQERKKKKKGRRGCI